MPRNCAQSSRWARGLIGGAIGASSGALIGFALGKLVMATYPVPDELLGFLEPAEAAAKTFLITAVAGTVTGIAVGVHKPEC